MVLSEFTETKMTSENTCEIFMANELRESRTCNWTRQKRVRQCRFGDRNSFSRQFTSIHGLSTEIESLTVGCVVELGDSIRFLDGRNRNSPVSIDRSNRIAAELTEEGACRLQ